MTARRHLLSRRLLLAALALLPTTAWAGSYLERAALLLDGANDDSERLRRRVHDRELSRVVHKLAKARVEAAATMHVPEEVAQAHPHLLLVLENYERSAKAALEGQFERFLVHLAKAREEEQTFVGVLKQLGWTLPKS